MTDQRPPIHVTDECQELFQRAIADPNGVDLTGGVIADRLRAVYDDTEQRAARLARPIRIQLRRTRGWRLPAGTVVVSRPTKWGNPFRYRQWTGLARVPAVEGGGEWEYEDRISADGMRHDFHHPDGRISVCHVRYMTRAEVVECYRRVLTDDLTESMRTAFAGCRILPFTVADVRRELAGRDMACWCPPDQPCHADVLLSVANTTPTEEVPDHG